jgi:hypothetical protein
MGIRRSDSQQNHPATERCRVLPRWPSAVSGCVQFFEDLLQVFWINLHVGFCSFEHYLVKHPKKVIHTSARLVPRTPGRLLTGFSMVPSMLFTRPGYMEI